MPRSISSARRTRKSALPFRALRFRFDNIQLDPVVGAAGGGGASPPAPPAATPAPPTPPPAPPAVDADLIKRLTATNPNINLDMAVTVDGHAHTLGQLVNSHKTATTQLAAADALKKANAAVYAPADKFNLDAAKSGMEVILQNAGWTDAAAIKAEIEKTYGTPKPATDPNAPVEDLRDKMMREQLDLSINTAASTPFTSHPVLSAIMRGIVARDGAEAGAAVLKEWQDQSLTMLKQSLFDRKAKEKTFSLTWIQEEATKVADKMAATLRRLSGDPRNMGKSQATGGGDPFATLDQAPIARPTATTTAGVLKSPSQVQDDMDKYTVDRLSRIAQGVLSDSAV